MKNEVKHIPIDDIFIEGTGVFEKDRLWRVFDKDVKSLQESIKEQGLITPIAVQERNGKYKLIAGEHRLTACKNLGWTEIPAHIIEREYEDDEIEDARLCILEADENLKRKIPDYISESHLLAYRKKAYDKLMAFKCNGMDPGAYKQKINIQIASIHKSGQKELSEIQEQEIENLKNERDNIKTFSQDTAEKLGGSEKNIIQKLKVARIIPEDKTDEIKENNISADNLQRIIVGKDEEETRKAAEIHLETIKDINSNLDKNINVNTIYAKAIKETKKDLDKSFQKNNPVEFAEMVADKVHEVIEVETKKKQNKSFKLTPSDLDDINDALSMYEEVEFLEIKVTVNGEEITIFDKFIK